MNDAQPQLVGLLITSLAEQQALTPEQKLALQAYANRFAAWTPAYRPYCVQTQVKCNSPRMILMDYGFRCPSCGNKIGHNGLRLDESPLNRSKHNGISI